MRMNHHVPLVTLLVAATSLPSAGVPAIDGGLAGETRIYEDERAASGAATGVDTRFGSGGVVSTATAPGASADYQHGMAVQPDGRILVGGTSDMGDAAGGMQWRLSRYTRHGDLDQTFGSNGTVLTSLSTQGGFDERLISIALQRDGRIVAAGSVQIGPDGVEDASAVVRYHPDGSLDASFGSRGVAVLDIAPGHDFVTQVAIDGSDRILVGGGCQHFFLARYRPDGSLDPSFNRAGGRPGVVITEVSPPGPGFTDEILGLAIDGRGRIVAAGYSIAVENGEIDVSSTVARYLPDGSLDASFNPHGARPGIVVTPAAPGVGWDVAFRVAIDRHGRIVTAGDAYVGAGKGGYDIALARYLPDGRLDRSFGDGGIVLTNAGAGDSDDDVQGLVIENSGRILIGGSAAVTAFMVDSDFIIARFHENGSPDTSFGRLGILRTPTGPDGADDEIWGVVLQTEARLIASGECDQPLSGRDVCLVRYKVGRDSPSSESSIAGR